MLLLCGCALHPEVLKRATVEAFAVRVPDELSSRDALVERGAAAAAAAAIRDDGPIKPRRPLHVRVEEARHRHPRRVLAPVREDRCSTLLNRSLLTSCMHSTAQHSTGARRDNSRPDRGLHFICKQFPAKWGSRRYDVERECVWVPEGSRRC